MTIRSLVQHFKEKPSLITDVGEFLFVKNIGQGGNANVLEFSRGGLSFAIKFLPDEDKQKVARFIDEFYCSSMIPTHVNVVRTYHFDRVNIGETTYLLIIMKLYSKSLHFIGTITSESSQVKEEKAIHLFRDICSGLRHLHKFGIIHRDIKPQNILFDSDENTFVIADLGIAHFNEEHFAKAANTEPTDRLANYLFSAPEQANSKISHVPASDIYALAQVIQWYLEGKPIKGLGRKRFVVGEDTQMLRILDSVIEKCLNDDATRRFQSIDDIFTFIKQCKEEKKADPWISLDKFDDTIRKSFPAINDRIETVSQIEIERFFNNFKEACKPQDFWYVLSDGGDQTYLGIEKLDVGRWLMNRTDEVSISKLIVHRDNSYPYKNFFIILIEPDAMFPIVDKNGQNVVRATSSWIRDYAELFKGKYISPSETKNGYYDDGKEIIEVTKEVFAERCRYLKPFAILIVPQQTASACMTDRSPTEALLESVVEKQGLDEHSLKIYLNATRGHHSSEITKWN